MGDQVYQADYGVHERKCQIRTITSIYSALRISLSTPSRKVSPTGNSDSFIKTLFLRTAVISAMATTHDLWIRINLFGGNSVSIALRLVLTIKGFLPLLVFIFI